MSLLSSKGVPLHGSLIVLWNTFSVVVQLSQIGNQDKASELTLDQEREIDAAWEKRGGEKISSQGAASDVVRVFGVTSLKSAGFKSIEKLLYASRLLKARWKRDGNAVHRR